MNATDRPALHRTLSVRLLLAQARTHNRRKRWRRAAEEVAKVWGEEVERRRRVENALRRLAMLCVLDLSLDATSLGKQLHDHVVSLANDHARAANERTEATDLLLSIVTAADMMNVDCNTTPAMLYTAETAERLLSHIGRARRFLDRVMPASPLVGPPASVHAAICICPECSARKGLPATATIPSPSGDACGCENCARDLSRALASQR